LVPEQQQLFPPATATGIRVGDINGDGIPDIVAGAASGSFYIFYGHGDGTFVTSAQTVAFGNGTTSQTSDVGIADLNGDGELDVAGITQAQGGTAQLDTALQTPA